MKDVNEVAARLEELQKHARESWGFVWKNDDDKSFASAQAASFDESFHYFQDGEFCLWGIETFRTAEDIESITPYFDDSEEDEDDWSCDLYFVFRGGKELLVTSYTVAGAVGFLLEVKSERIQTQDPEEIQAYFRKNR